MKISIITLHYINHYGSLLQTYATCEMFKKMGHEAQIIDYIRPNVEEPIMMKSALDNKGYGAHSLKGLAFIASKKIENKKRREFSERFLKKYVDMTRRYKDYNDLKSNPPEADIYCTGSDQTWNSKYNGGILPAYYLDFAPEGKKKIGYSVSIGMHEIPENEVEETKKYVMQYDAISVRENSAKTILENLGYQNAVQIIDPTLALTKDDWLPLIAPRMIKEKYIIIYKLNDNPELEVFAVELAKNTGCKLVRMSYYLNHFKYPGKMIYSPEVGGFLSLINYADYVITDSFHCLAFSLNFGKNFFAFYPGKYSTRLKSILELTGTTHRAVGTKDFSDTIIDYGHVDKVLTAERTKVEDYIRVNCND